MVRQLTDVHGDTYVYSYKLTTGVALSLLVGFVASFLGIGGGIVHVPMMVLLLHFPAHIATATSQYVLAVTALTGTLVHLVAGEYAIGLGRIAALAVGVVVGAQIGARLSTRLRGGTIVRLLGLALLAVSLRLLGGVLF